MRTWDSTLALTACCSWLFVHVVTMRWDFDCWTQFNPWRIRHPHPISESHVSLLNFKSKPSNPLVSRVLVRPTAHQTDNRFICLFEMSRLTAPWTLYFFAANCAFLPRCLPTMLAIRCRHWDSLTTDRTPVPSPVIHVLAILCHCSLPVTQS